MGNEIQNRNEQFMREAIKEAIRAEEYGEVPVGAVLVQNGQIIARGFNQPIGLNDPSAHAEVQCLRNAGEVIKNYRFIGATMYVTLEPCPMCAGALVHSRIERLVYGAKDERFGAVDTHWKIGQSAVTNHRFKVISGVLAQECGALLSEFFRKKRQS